MPSPKLRRNRRPAGTSTFSRSPDASPIRCPSARRTPTSSRSPSSIRASSANATLHPSPPLSVTSWEGAACAISCHPRAVSCSGLSASHSTPALNANTTAAATLPYLHSLLLRRISRSPARRLMRPCNSRKFPSSSPLHASSLHASLSTLPSPAVSSSHPASSPAALISPSRFGSFSAAFRSSPHPAFAIDASGSFCHRLSNKSRSFSPISRRGILVPSISFCSLFMK